MKQFNQDKIINHKCITCGVKYKIYKYRASVSSCKKCIDVWLESIKEK